MIIQGHGRSKNQGNIRSDKEMDHDIDISNVNVFDCIFYRRFKDENMSTQFVHLF